MIHHVSVGSNDIAAARGFYDPVLAVLGIRVLASDAESADYGSSDFFFSVETPVDRCPASAGNGVHIAFQARDRGVVREFHRTGLATAARMPGHPACARSTTATTTAPSCSTLTATRSRRSPSPPTEASRRSSASGGGAAQSRARSGPAAGPNQARA